MEDDNSITGQRDEGEIEELEVSTKDPQESIPKLAERNDSSDPSTVAEEQEISTTIDQQNSAPVTPGGEEIASLRTDTTQPSVDRQSTILSSRENENETEQKGIQLESTWKQYLPLFSVFIVCLIWITITIAYAFLSSSSHSVTIFTEPAITIFMLQLLIAS
jgi:hypothetical protein